LGADLFNAMRAWAGKLPGSLAMATVFTGAAFGAVCGDSFATAATIGKVAIPEMKKAGYPLPMASGAVAAGGTLGIMIPPSTIFIIYAIVTETSIAKLFIAGIIPGIMLAVLISIALYIQAVRDPRFKEIEVRSYTLKEKIIATKGVLPIVLLFLLCIGGIYLGWFTPVEGGAVGAFGSFVFILLRDLKHFKFSMLSDSLLEAANISGMILFLMAGIEFINSSLALSKIPMDLADALFNSGLSDWMIFWIFILLFLAAGFILNIVVVLLLTVPILLPSLTAMNLDLIWFGVIFTLVTMIGQLTPPIGVVCFVVRTLDKDLKLEDVFKGVTALWMAMIVGLVLLIIFPDIALFLGSFMK
ncbi:MAG TPA: TRAP transporter large permease, partial [Firmicutes bacterium]|nr:TRAP transporter large permease [Bacillota bacterium]